MPKDSKVESKPIVKQLERTSCWISVAHYLLLHSSIGDKITYEQVDCDSRVFVKPPLLRTSMGTVPVDAARPALPDNFKILSTHGLRAKNLITERNRYLDDLRSRGAQPLNAGAGKPSQILDYYSHRTGRKCKVENYTDPPKNLDDVEKLIRQSLEGGMPVIAKLGSIQLPGWNHAVAIVAIATNAKLTFRDPADGKQTDVSFAAFFTGTFKYAAGYQANKNLSAEYAIDVGAFCEGLTFYLPDKSAGAATENKGEHKGDSKGASGVGYSLWHTSPDADPLAVAPGQTTFTAADGGAATGPRGMR